MFSIFDGVFPIHDDHCKLTFTTSTSFFVSRAHTQYRVLFSLTPHVWRLYVTKNCIRLLFIFCLAADLLYISINLSIDMIR